MNESKEFLLRIETHTFIDELMSMQAVIRAVFKIVSQNKSNQEGFPLKVHEIVTTARAEILNHKTELRDIFPFSFIYLTNNLRILFDIHEHNQKQLIKEKSNDP